MPTCCLNFSRRWSWVSTALLAWAAALSCPGVIHTVGGVLQVGMSPLVGNREGVSELTGWEWPGGPSQHVGKHGALAALVLVGHATGAFNEMTALGAQIFFWARLAYLVIYIGGIPWARTALYVSVIGMVLIFAQLV